MGALIVREDGREPVIVGRGWHCGSVVEPHAETEALPPWRARRARGATLYVTLEPCSHYGQTPPCANVIVHGEIERVASARPPIPISRVAGEGYAILQSSRALQLPTASALTAAGRRPHGGHIDAVSPEEAAGCVPETCALGWTARRGWPGGRQIADHRGGDARAQVLHDAGR